MTGGGVAPHPVVQEPPERRVELVGQLDHLLELFASRRHAQPAPDALAAREAGDPLHRRAALHLRIGVARPGQPGRGRLDRLRRVRAAAAGSLIADDRVGLQQVRQRRGHVPDLVAGRLVEPAEKAFVDRCGAGRLERRVLDDRGLHRADVAEAEQPVGRQLVRRRQRGDGVEAGQAGVGPGEQLRQRGSVDPGGGGERARG